MDERESLKKIKNYIELNENENTTCQNCILKCSYNSVQSEICAIKSLLLEKNKSLQSKKK